MLLVASFVKCLLSWKTRSMVRLFVAELGRIPAHIALRLLRPTPRREHHLHHRQQEECPFHPLEVCHLMSHRLWGRLYPHRSGHHLPRHRTPRPTKADIDCGCVTRPVRLGRHIRGGCYRALCRFGGLTREMGARLLHRRRPCRAKGQRWQA